MTLCRRARSRMSAARWSRSASTSSAANVSGLVSAARSSRRFTYLRTCRSESPKTSAARLNETGTDGSNGSSGRTEYELSLFCLRAGDMSSALLAFEQAVAINPNMDSIGKAAEDLRRQNPRTIH